MFPNFSLYLQNTGRALNEILFMVETHVHELNDIFGNTVFKTKLKDRIVAFQGIQFEIRKVQVIMYKSLLK